MIEIIRNPAPETWKKILQRPCLDNENLDQIVASVLSKVKEGGDKAIKAYEKEFDNVDLDDLSVSIEEINACEELIAEDLKSAIRLAIRNITCFHESQKTETTKIETMPGVLCWQKSVGIEKVGLYIPGGTAPLFSTVLMLAIPAKIAGCKEIILCSPPNTEGKINPAILFAAKETGINKIFKIGGIQAIAAMAYGTESVPKVYKIFGPGNQYVTSAKQQVNLKDVAIDMPAGPSEVLVIADESANPAFVAADLLSQAEHGADSQVILVSTSEKVLLNTINEIEQQLQVLPRKHLASIALTNSKFILLHSKKEIVELSNTYAPEHLIIETEDYSDFADRILNAGSVFLGHYSPESAGDYASGTNHTLPTNAYATAYSGVNLDSFLKKITFQEISKEGIHNIGSSIEIMAEHEGLFAHKNAVTLRLKY
ncbi:histidinol dehydrogenase [Bacteroidales bacterium]|nr:histidinol dehydrogenase [Bacteroidales bacterium]